MEAGDGRRGQIGRGFQTDDLRIVLAGNGREDIDVVPLVFPAIDRRAGGARMPRVVVRQMAVDRRSAIVAVRMNVHERTD